MLPVLWVAPMTWKDHRWVPTASATVMASTGIPTTAHLVVSHRVRPIPCVQASRLVRSSYSPATRGAPSRAPIRHGTTRSSAWISDTCQDSWNSCGP